MQKPWNSTAPKRSLGIFDELGGVLDARAGRDAQKAKAQQTLEDRLIAGQQREAANHSRSIEDALKEAQAAGERAKASALSAPKVPKIIGTKEDPTTGEVFNTYDDGTAKPVTMPESGGMLGSIKPLRLGVKQEKQAQSSYSFPVVTDENGRQVIARANSRTGEVTPTDVGAKPTGSTARLTDPQEKSYLFYNLMKNAEPEITKTLSTGRIRPAAVSAYLGAGSASEIPFIGKAIGMVAKPAANANLNEDEQKLIRAGKDFTAGVLRKESGAAVTASELMETMERYFPGMFGDKPGLTDAKTLARQQYMQTMEQEAGPAIRFYGQQRSTPSTGGTRPPAAGGRTVVVNGKTFILPP